MLKMIGSWMWSNVNCATRDKDKSSVRHPSSWQPLSDNILLVDQLLTAFMTTLFLADTSSYHLIMLKTTTASLWETQQNTITAYYSSVDKFINRWRGKRKSMPAAQRGDVVCPDLSSAPRHVRDSLECGRQD